MQFSGAVSISLNWYLRNSAHKPCCRKLLYGKFELSWCRDCSVYFLYCVIHLCPYSITSDLLKTNCESSRCLFANLFEWWFYCQISTTESCALRTIHWQWWTDHCFLSSFRFHSLANSKLFCYSVQFWATVWAVFFIMMLICIHCIWCFHAFKIHWVYKEVYKAQNCSKTVL